MAVGDSGGALAFQHDGQWYVLGVVSAGETNRLSYSAFTRVSAYLAWIIDVIRGVH